MPSDSLDNETLLDKLLEIYRIALSHDYSSGPVNTQSAQLLPQDVLATLTLHLNADGGNFSIYRANGNYLDVRGWYCSYQPHLTFPEFSNIMQSLASLPLRAQSSSYRCLDTNAPILIPVSNSVDPHLMTLDVATLQLKDGLSALAAPLHYHERPMGVIHMDITDTTTHTFGQTDLVFLEYVADLLSPILHHNLMIEQLRRITSACFNQPSGAPFSFAQTLCSSAAEILLMPSVGLWLADEHQQSPFILRGSTGPYFIDTVASAVHRIPSLDDPLLDNAVFAAQAETEVSLELIPSHNTPFRFSDAHPSLYGLFLPLLDEQTRARSGFIGLVDASPIPSRESYRRLRAFVAHFLSLTLGALSRYEARERISYETSAHELRRNLKNLDNTHKRLATQLRHIDNELVRTAHPLDDAALGELNTICNAFKSHLLAAIETQQNLVRRPTPTEIRETYGNKYDDYIPINNPILHQAQIRQDRVALGNSTQSVDIYSEILDICNGYTQSMRKKSVTWSWRMERTPRLFNVDRQNFNLVFGNLADNAVKYAMPGSLIIVSLIIEDLRIVIDVTNTGPPIDTHGPERADIFLPYQRGRLASCMCEGDGIGLWQAKYVANLWGGDVRLTDSTAIPPKGKGDAGMWARNTFTIELPDTPSSHRTFKRRQ